MKKQTWWETQRITIFMFLIFLGGIILLFISYWMELRSFGEWQLIHDLGISFTIASILGVSVDQILRRRLAKDAFEASVGYLLPEELKGEMEWIYSTHILCVEHSQRCELSQLDNETCCVHVDMLRKFRNISSSNEAIIIGLGIDEWFHNSGTSKIVSFGYNKLGAQVEINEINKRAGGVVAVKEQKVSLAPNEEITIWFKTEEIKRTNDELWWNFGYPTLNPTVTVKAFDGVSITVSFGYRSSAEQLGIGTHRLTGTLLPSQGIRIRWWDENKVKRWISEV